MVMTNRSGGTLIRQLPLLLLDLLVPGSCISCGCSVSLSDRNLCSSCFEEIEYLGESCGRCSGIMDKGSCAICSSREFYLERNICVADFSGVMKDIIENYKFNGRRSLKRVIAGAVFKKIDLKDLPVDILTSVPVNRRKKWKRGYNHSEDISKTLSGMINIPYRELLSEKRKRGGQKFLGYRERFLNIINRFGVKRGVDISGKRILLVDDIFTTGATINECARVLRAQGALAVFSLTIARTGVKKA
jgi:competence protein ComFC